MSRLADTTSAVTVMFKDAAFIFALPPGATLEDIARRIEGIETQQFGTPVSIDVKLRH